MLWNCDEEYDIIMTNKFNKKLIDDSNFVEGFMYTDILYDYCSEFTQELYDYLKNFTKDKISFIEDLFEIKDMNYMKFDDWWNQLQKLIRKLHRLLEKHKKWEKEDINNDYFI
jgi:hypothetical protein